MDNSIPIRVVIPATSGNPTKPNIAEEYHTGGLISEDGLREIIEKLKEKPSWWLLNGEIIHCTSWELSIREEIQKLKKQRIRTEGLEVEETE